MVGHLTGRLSMGVSYRGHYGELIILLAWFKSKHTHQSTHNGELPNMTPQRLKYYQEALASRLAQGFTLHPQLIKEFVKERIQSS